MKEKKEKLVRKVKTPYGYEWLCPVCNEHIPMYTYVPSTYAYKLLYNFQLVYFDSWSCMRKFEKEHNLENSKRSKETYYKTNKYKD